jgi:hypothetical protein
MFKFNETNNYPVMTMDPENNITLLANNSEMLKVSPDGFYVRGIKLEQDEKEAKAVFDAFHGWLTWAALTRNY